MNAKRFCIAGAATFLAVSLAAAQEVLPKAEEAFKDAKIGRTYKDSKPGTIALTKAPAGAPNVLIILIDDSGFGQWSTFGGQVPTPNLDRLAKMGLRYTRFHTTALCSPTRAALLTGRNHHSAGTGVITEIGDGYPGYSGQIPKSAGMFAEVLRQGGCSTAFIGKNHNIADWETSISGPYDRSEANDLSAKYPEKLEELQNDFWIEAKKYDVLPLDDRFSERGDPSLRPSLIAGRTDFTYYPGATRIPEPSASNTKNTWHTITATIEVPQGGADGVLVAEGGAAGGYTLYIKDV